MMIQLKQIIIIHDQVYFIILRYTLFLFITLYIFHAEFQIRWATIMILLGCPIPIVRTERIVFLELKDFAKYIPPIQHVCWEQPNKQIRVGRSLKMIPIE